MFNYYINKISIGTHYRTVLQAADVVSFRTKTRIQLSAIINHRHSWAVTRVPSLTDGSKSYESYRLLINRPTLYKKILYFSLH